jgi:hypothetical protein
MEAKPAVQIIELLSRVMEDVGAVRKGERNQAQNFNFRGIDAVVNAVSPALRKHGVVVTPEIVSNDYTTVEVGKNRTSMGHCRVTVAYTFWAPDGSCVTSTVSAESMDSGDKATAKAMSVAFRTCLLQTLCLPTDETDPDHEVYERAPRRAAEPKQKVQEVVDTDELSPEQRQQLLAACAKAGIDPNVMARNAGLEWDGDVKNSDIPALREAFKELKAFKDGQ